jgi:hypothetical protein
MKINLAKFFRSITKVKTSLPGGAMVRAVFEGVVLGVCPGDGSLPDHIEIHEPNLELGVFGVWEFTGVLKRKGR